MLEKDGRRRGEWPLLVSSSNTPDDRSAKAGSENINTEQVLRSDLHPGRYTPNQHD